jgi:hypothetical protein
MWRVDIARGSDRSKQARNSRGTNQPLKDLLLYVPHFARNVLNIIHNLPCWLAFILTIFIQIAVSILT